MKTDEGSTDGRCEAEQESGGDMFYGNRISQCSICKAEYTSFHFEVMPACRIYVCGGCMEMARDHFIWVCLNCGSSFSRPKNVVMNRIHNYGLKEAVFLYENRIIHGIEGCLNCSPDMILEYNDILGECAP